MITTNKTIAIVLMFFGAAIILPANSEISKWTDENGNVHYGDVVPEKYREQAESINAAPANIIETKHSPAFPKTHNKNKKKPNKNNASSAKKFKNEKRCQKIYGLNCSQINNWQKNAQKSCQEKKGGKKCNDQHYLKTKYKPRTLKEKRLQATRNANRRKKEALKQR